MKIVTLQNDGVLQSLRDIYSPSLLFFYRPLLSRVLSHRQTERCKDVDSSTRIPAGPDQVKVTLHNFHLSQPCSLVTDPWYTSVKGKFVSEFSSVAPRP